MLTFRAFLVLPQSESNSDEGPTLPEGQLSNFFTVATLPHQLSFLVIKQTFVRIKSSTDRGKLGLKVDFH